MKPSWAERRIVVTGAGSGIGRTIALRFGEAGADLTLVGRREAPLRLVAERVPDWLVRTIVADLGDPAGLDQAIKEVTRAHKRIDVLIHSAATFQLGPWNALTPSRLDELYRVNFRAPVLLTRSLLPALKAAQGAIVFLNSSAALEGGTNCGAYAALKASLKVFADTLRQEVNADRIRVLSVFPGRTASPMQERIFAAEGRTYPAERLLQPEDIASQVLAILSLPSTAEVTDLSIRPFQPIA